MGRAATLVFVLAGLVSSGWQAWNHHRPSAKAVMETGAGREAAFELHSAGDQLNLTYKWAGTYDGPDLKNFKDLQLSRADEKGFCIQAVKDAKVFRLVGPGGKPEPGRC